MNPPSALPSRPRRKAAEKALIVVHNTYGGSTKRPRNTSIHRVNKAQKRTRDQTPSRTLSQGDDTCSQYKPTPTHKRMPNHSGLVEEEDIVYVDEIEHRILTEARGNTRKNIPYDTFRSTFLSRFKHKNKRPQLNIQDIKNVGNDNWEQSSFFLRLQKALPKKVLKGLSLSSSFSKTLSGPKRGKEPLSQPDFFFHLGTGTGWAHVELVFEHTQSPIQKASEKFLQWLRGAWHVFYHQPFRRYLYGILFLKPYTLITYVDHGCAGYSEPLDFVKKPQHTQFLADFLADFIANPEHRGRDPHITAHQKDGSIFIEYAGIKWTEAPNSLLCYRPCVFGRHLRVTRVHPVDSPNDKWVMKDAWEEKLEHPSPPPEEEVISILIEANVRGIPQLHESCRSTTEGSDSVEASDDNMEVLTSEFPPNCENALAAITKQAMMVVESGFVSGRASKSSSSRPPTGTTGQEHLQQAKGKRKLFNKCADVRRRRARLIISYCQPLKEAMRNAQPKELMRTIRDAMIVYYEAYKRPEHGFLHGDISIENIMVPVEETQLTGGLTHKTLRGTLIDWNLCFTADGRASSRNIQSGTIAFMAPSLLRDDPVPRRTLGHDMESFFAVMLWIASLNYDDHIAFQNKPLVKRVVGNKSSTEDIADGKLHWFENPKAFKKSILNHFEQPYRKDGDFVKCTRGLRHILYKRNYDEDTSSSSEGELTNLETNDDDPMKERLFKDCMAVFDKHLGDEGKQSGSYQLNKIDAGEDLEESEESFDTDSAVEDLSDD
ncbi:uncharacterized protein Z518_10683 [Rhinocladiella mackenziei CBS 650.93]|uniref:Rhinocladiella mackenziei CBS 650.93 unplaced genomic scaffold supercont1.10, whole genome shotgun sequence n=1 Tax=Rhinocladiella mackenziei CBS 650.93 TaxID=1442369 RepID=A0A0D2I919_9EURO|nr:uncharacterized protein Z518_10683 [Rhinocladiella mackenziei CBS 650.93]KIW99755.1 hypothetical protein Z518_10683 [Rhinocladiella mackenziei CBS 650.93]